jgi:predicted kinase
MLRPGPAFPSFRDLLSLVPAQDGSLPDWQAIWPIWEQLSHLDTCPQDPEYHAEGDVGIHTRMVVEALVADPIWQGLPVSRAAGLFWAAVLHDIGKPGLTKKEDGRITSRGHSGLGARIARLLLWQADAPFDWREEICGLISTHQAPFWMIERDDPERLAAELSWICNSADLCLHARADARGRTCKDQDALLQAVDLAALQFSEAGCLGARYPFENDESRIAAFTRPDRSLSHVAHESFSCTATLMCGLPGSGKDSWIEQNGGDCAIISLDDMRKAAGISHKDNQGKIIQAAREAARQNLRQGRDFIWNATNLTKTTRTALLGLFRDYGARTEIVYVEVPPNMLFEQNAGREDAIPRRSLENYIEKLEVPNRLEAHGLTCHLR